MTPKISRFLTEHAPKTPCLVVDLDVIERHYRNLQRALPCAHIHYAVKANPALPILKRLVSLGASFDTASIGEIRLCLQAGAAPERLSYGNTVKQAAMIREAYRLGVRLFAFDTQEELEKIALHAPQSQVFCRLTVANKGAEWPLSHKFGASASYAHRLMHHAASLGLHPCGLSFHVGSQQTQADAYQQAIEMASALYRTLKDQNLPLRFLNLGGGFPAHYGAAQTIPSLDALCRTIRQSLDRQFPEGRPDIMLEPGRFLVAESGVVSSEVLLVSRRGRETDSPRWVYLDIGRFGGMAETEGETIRYTFRTAHDAEEAPRSPCIIAGPSCDSVDILYEKNPISLPDALSGGDKVTILSTGAYVASYCSTGFNGFPPLDEHYL